MTQRERVLASSLLGVVILVGVALLFHVVFLGPLSQVREESDALREEIQKKQDEHTAEKDIIDRALALSPRLNQWKQLSLPASKDSRLEEIHRHLAALQVDYERYLSDLLRRSGFASESILVTPRSLDTLRASSIATKGAPPVFRTLTFNAQGQADLSSLVKMLEEFHKAGLLQQVRSLIVQKPQNEKSGSRGTLDVTMNVEVLLVSGAEHRDGLMPDTSVPRPHVLAEPAKNYADLAYHNIFTGTQPIASKEQSQTEDPRDVLGFIKLTSVSNVNGRGWEAWLYDQSKKDGEFYLRESKLFNEFSYSDRYENVLVHGDVVHIDITGVLFKMNGRFYHIGVGESLYDAVREPLSTTPLPAAGIAIGAGWAAPW